MTRPRKHWLGATLLLLALCQLHCGSAGPRELRIATRGTIDNPDPYSENSVVTFSVYSNIYEPLVALDRFLKLTPVLAKEWRNPDDLTWVFTLRPGVRFHDGSALTAEDARASLERARDPATAAASDALWMIDRVEAVNPLELKITTRMPYSSLLSNLTEILILPSKSLAGKRAVPEFAPGTGPYFVRRWKPGSFVLLERNASYWGGLPEIQLARFVAVPGLQDRVNGLKNGAYDILPQLEPAVSHDPSIAGNKKIRITSQQGVGVIYLGMDLERKKSPYVQAVANPFLDLRVRKALLCGINTKHIVKDILEGFADEASQMVAPLIYGYNPGLVRPAYDPDRARALLAEAGYPNGFAVRFDFSKDRYRNDEEIGRSISSDLEKIGIHVRQNALTRQQLFDLLDRNDTSLYMVGWFLTNGDASNLFDFLIHSRNKSFGYGGQNVGGYSNPEMDRLIETTAAMADPAFRAEALRKMMKQAMDDLPYIPLHTEHNFCASSAALEWQPRADEYLFVKDIRWK